MDLLAYPLGEKIIIEHLDEQVGGGGTNTAVAFSRLGFQTAYLGKIGQDDSGLSVFRLLKKENVDFVGTLGKSTGTSIILDSIATDRTILAFKGCNNHLDFNEIHQTKLKTKWFYFSSMMGKSLKTLFKLSQFASENNIKIVFNPSCYLAELGVQKLKVILDNTNIIILNKEEAEILVGKDSINNVLSKLRALVKSYAVITDGAKGAYCTDGESVLFAKPLKNVKILETTGAGDAFASGFSAGIISGKDMKTAFRMGFIESEAVIEAYGAKNNLLSKGMLQKKLKNDTRLITEKVLRLTPEKKKKTNKKSLKLSKSKIKKKPNKAIKKKTNQKQKRKSKKKK